MKLHVSEIVSRLFRVIQVSVIFSQRGDMWIIHRGRSPRWMNHVSRRCLKITGLFFTWARFHNKHSEASTVSPSQLNSYVSTREPPHHLFLIFPFLFTELVLNMWWNKHWLIDNGEPFSCFQFQQPVSTSCLKITGLKLISFMWVRI